MFAAKANQMNHRMGLKTVKKFDMKDDKDEKKVRIILIITQLLHDNHTVSLSCLHLSFSLHLKKQEKPEWAEGTKKKEADTKSEATEGDVAIEEEEE